MSEPPAERSRGALFLLAAVFAAAGLWFVVGSDEAASSPSSAGPGRRASSFRSSRRAGSRPSTSPRSRAGSCSSTSGRPGASRASRRCPRWSGSTSGFPATASSSSRSRSTTTRPRSPSSRARYSLTFPIVLDPDKQVAEAYQTMGVPESLLIDADGRIVERYVGPREWDAPEYVERIEALFAGRVGRRRAGGRAVRGRAPPASIDAERPRPGKPQASEFVILRRGHGAPPTDAAGSVRRVA